MPVPTRTSLSDAPDELLGARAAEGDVRAFEVLVRRYGPMMRAYGTRVLGSRADADDVAQEALIVAWERLPTLTDLGAIRPWLMRIVGRKAIDRARSRRDEADVDDWDPPTSDSESPSRRAEVASASADLAHALAVLPPDQRRCWVLKHIGELSYEDIGKELGVPVSTVRGLLARARKTIYREMEAWR